MEDVQYSSKLLFEVHQNNEIKRVIDQILKSSQQKAL